MRVKFSSEDFNYDFYPPLRKSIPYRRLYRFGQWYDIFRIPVNTGIPFRVYRYYFIYIYIYIYIHILDYLFRIIHKSI